MSPEMISDSQCDYEADFWALGVTIYKMLTNKYPFDGEGNFDLFENIKEGKFVYPEDMDKNAQDLISKILKVEPAERLGCGKKGSKNDISALKEHPFFKGIDWENIYEQHSPARVSHKVFSVSHNNKIMELEQNKPKIKKTGLVKKLKMLNILWNTRQLI